MKVVKIVSDHLEAEVVCDSSTSTFNPAALTHYITFQRVTKATIWRTGAEVEETAALVVLELAGLRSMTVYDVIDSCSV